MLELVGIILCTFFFVGGGITALWKGRIPATKTTAIEGLPARVVGLLLLLAIPLAFLAGFFSDPIVKTFGIPPNPQSAQPMVVFCVPLLACPLLGAIVGFVFAKKTAGRVGAGPGGGAGLPGAHGGRHPHPGRGQDD
jgi:hypothetical protein